MERPAPVELVFHGSFAPAHPGHAACLIDTIAELQHQGMEIQTIHLGLTEADHAAGKPLGTSWTDAKQRARLLEA
eukprot:1197461-Amphidinium_carterae.1